MSIRVLNLVWEHSKHKGSSLILLLAIADFADDDGVAFPGIETLARKSRMSERNTRYVIATLEESKELTIERGTGPYGTHRYRVMVTPNLELFGRAAKSAAAEKIAPPAKFAGAATERIGGVQPSVKRGATAIAPEPSLTVKEPERSARAARGHRLPEDFKVSSEITAWAQQHGFEKYLELHFAYLVDWAKSNPTKVCADWDARFRNCVRGDWGGVRRQAQIASRVGGTGAHWSATPETTLAKANELKIASIGLSWPALKAKVSAELERRSVPA